MNRWTWIAAAESGFILIENSSCCVCSFVWYGLIVFFFNHHLMMLGSENGVTSRTKVNRNEVNQIINNIVPKINKLQ